MIEIRTNYGSKAIRDEEAKNGVYHLDNGEIIVAARVYGTSIVPDYAFMDLTDLESVIIEEGVESIGHLAFKSAKNLNSISFPSTLTEMEADCFDGCSEALIQSFPERITGLFEVAKEKRREAEEAEKKRLAELALQQEKLRLESERRAEEYKRKLMEQLEEKKEREREEAERRRKEYEQARNPRNSDEEMLLRVFGDKIDLAQARVSDDGEYTFGLYPEGYSFIYDRELTVSLTFAPSGSRRRTSIKINWDEETDDVYNWNEFLCEEVAGLAQALESSGIPTEITPFCQYGDDHDYFEICIEGKASVAKSKTEDLLSRLRDAMNEGHTETYQGSSWNGYAMEWFNEFFTDKSES